MRSWPHCQAQELRKRKKTKAVNYKPLPLEELKGIHEVILAHDDREGSATMARKVFQDLLAKESLSLSLKKVHIDNLKADASSLVITKRRADKASAVASTRCSPSICQQFDANVKLPACNHNT